MHSCAKAHSHGTRSATVRRRPRPTATSADGHSAATATTHGHDHGRDSAHGRVHGHAHDHHAIAEVGLGHDRRGDIAPAVGVDAARTLAGDVAYAYAALAPGDALPGDAPPGDAAAAASGARRNKCLWSVTASISTTSSQPRQHRLLAPLLAPNQLGHPRCPFLPPVSIVGLPKNLPR